MDTITNRRQNWSLLENAKDDKWQKIEKLLKLGSDEKKYDTFEERMKQFRRNRLHVMTLNTEAARKLHHFQ